MTSFNIVSYVNNYTQILNNSKLYLDHIFLKNKNCYKIQ